MDDPQPVDHSPAADQGSPQRTERRDRARIVVAGIVGALLTAFALLNLDDVKVHWLIATGQTPLILVIVLAFGLGVAVDRLFVIRGRRKSRRTPDVPDN